MSTNPTVWIAPELPDAPIAANPPPVLQFQLTADELRQLKNARAIIDRLIASVVAQSA